MPNYSTFRPYQLPQKAVQKLKLSVEQFYGVDYNPSQITVPSYRAVDIKNILFKDKVNQKRFGFEQLAQIKPVTYYTEGSTISKTNPVAFNGFWSFYDDKGNKRNVAHIGNLLFEIKGVGKDKSPFAFTTELIYNDLTSGSNPQPICKELLNIKSCAFVGDGRLYILGGNKYYVVKRDNSLDNETKLIINEVEDDVDTFIPTTTVGITYADSPVNERTALDDVSLMTQWRKNKLVSGTYVDDGVSLRTTRYWDWTLDAPIKPKKDEDLFDMEITILQAEEEE